MLNIAIFVSGNGSNAENIITTFADNDTIKVSLVVSNKADAYGLTRAQRLGVESRYI
jgi:phosphoribosylglycinamide formyltransferase-1